MSHYGISQIHIGTNGGVAEAKLHNVLKTKDGYGLDEGKPVPYQEVASLIVKGNDVRVMEIDGGPQEYIESCDDKGNSTTALSALPKF